MGKTRKSKVFVDSKDAAIELAKSVADVQEKKSRARVEVRQKAKASTTLKKPVEKKDTTSSKARLEHAKAVVAAQAAQVKRQKAKIRKKARVAVPDADTYSTHKGTGENSEKPNGRPTKKRVTFG